MIETGEIRESSVGAASKPLRVDRAKGIIYDVCILREQGNDEFPRATREKALPLIQGKRVYVDHGPPGALRAERSYRDALGMVVDPYERGDGVFAREFRFNPEHELAGQLCWDAENAPHLLGFSIYGDAQKRRRADGRKVVEAITKLDSCDLVTTPAHGGGIYESRRATMKVSELIESLKPTRPGASRALREMAASGIMSDAAEVPEPAAMPDGATEASDHEATFLNGVCDAICQVVRGKLSWDEKISQVSAYMKTARKHTGPEAEKKEKPGEKPDDKKAEESARVKTHEERAIREIARKGVTLTPVLEMAAQGCKSDEDVTRLVESLGAGNQQQRPGARSAAPQPEPDGKAGKEGVRESQTTPSPDEERKRRLAQKRALR